MDGDKYVQLSGCAIGLSIVKKEKARKKNEKAEEMQKKRIRKE